MELRSYAGTSNDSAEKRLDCPLCETSTSMRDGRGDSSPFAGTEPPVWQPCRLLTTNGHHKSVADLVSNGYPHIICSSHTSATKTTVEQGLCGQSQNHLLSVLLQPVLHEHCPDNCQDWLSSLPQGPLLLIFSYLDPVSLLRCASVCRAWRDLTRDPYLWQRLCALPQWRVSPATERKQLQLLRRLDGQVDWRAVFCQRFRLRRNWLRGSCHVRTFHGHTQAVFCVQFDDTRIVSGSSDKTIKVWNMRTNSPWSVMTLVGHSGTVRCLHLSGNRLVSGSSDCTIKVWDLSTEHSWSSIACKGTMVGHIDTVRCLQADQRQVVSGSYDRTLKASLKSKAPDLWLWKEGTMLKWCPLFWFRASHYSSSLEIHLLSSLLQLGLH
ncbi:hypothetical protein HPB48_006976 [Haemaphysalis longicornis]|uniref:F-box domain-containing protein n=1 Tax=Haemaphysalis longicornis TaxID=44386 RepID=A0A9J6FNG7_HAELO|nr:hypothetical protein HPB48_006976 [Haemaphysalis longicornis]